MLSRSRNSTVAMWLKRNELGREWSKMSSERGRKRLMSQILKKYRFYSEKNGKLLESFFSRGVNMF